MLSYDWESLEEIVGTAIDYVNPVLGNRKVIVQLKDDLPLLWVDRNLVEQLLVNVLENVAKHAEGSSFVLVKANLDDETVEIRVEDDGPGFQVVGDKATTGSGPENQTGLGMKICRTIVEAHGGNLSFSNRENGGARVTVRLPIKHGPEPL